MRETISLEKKTTHPSLVLALVVGGMLALVMTQAPSADAQKYSDWSAPVNLGSLINSASSDQGPAISKDGLSLYFTSNGPASLGGPFDMYVCASVDDPWGTPITQRKFCGEAIGRRPISLNSTVASSSLQLSRRET